MNKGFTLIETMVAVTLLSVAIVAPMTLTAKSLAAAYYARDQITAFHLAQEAVESVRHLRDNNILKNINGTQTDLLSGVPLDQAFIIDTRDDHVWTACPGGIPALKSNGLFYAYGSDPCNPSESGWNTTRFTRTIHATNVRSDTNGVPQEINLSVQVSWTTGAFQQKTFTISENLYRWVNDNVQ